MPTFDLTAGDRFLLEIEGQGIEFLAREHPNAPGMAHAFDGGKATVFRVGDAATDKDYALKVMRRQHRDPGLVEICERLQTLRTLRGLAACDRVCLTDASAGTTVRRYPDLQYAIVMQWITGRTWFDMVRSRTRVSPGDALRLGRRLAAILCELEDHSLSHCDIAGGNVIVDPTTLDIELIDVEDVHGPGFRRPSALPLGTQGYQHRTSASGQWSADADRFAGAVMLAEMLGWYDPSVRAAAWGESYFDPAELQAADSARYPVLRAALDGFGGDLGGLLDRAWSSSELAQCPPLAAWQRELQGASPPAADAPTTAVTGWAGLAVPPDASQPQGSVLVPLPPVEPAPPPGSVFAPLPPVEAPPATVQSWSGPIPVPEVADRLPPFWSMLPARTDPTPRRS